MRSSQGSFARDGYSLGFEVSNGNPALPTLILVNGSLFNRRQWDLPVAMGLGRGCRVIRYDYGGTGCSPRGGIRWDLQELGDELLSLLDHLGVERAHLYGISKGTAVMQMAAVRAPQRVASLAGYGWVHLGYSGAEKLAAGFGRLLSRFDDLAVSDSVPLDYAQFERMWERVYEVVLSQSIAVSPILRWRGCEWVLKRAAFRRLEPTPLRHMYEWFRYVASELPLARAFFEQLSQCLVRVPALIQHARGDRTLPVACARELYQAMPQWQYREYPDRWNHVTPLVSPFAAWEVAREHRRFVRALVGA